MPRPRATPAVPAAPTDLPDLEGWAVFAKVAETGAFARAAAELGWTQSTVSKAVARLEARLGTALLRRTSRRLSLTESGERALAHASQLLAQAQALEAEITDQARELRGPIRLSAPMSFGVAHVAPLLPAFLVQHPGVSLDLHLSDAQVDLIGERFDLALRIAQLEDSSLLALRLCEVPRLLVGAPAYFAQHGTPRHPADLARLQGLTYAYARGGNAWRFTHRTSGDIHVQPLQGPLRVNNAEALIPALLAGLGVALQPAFLVWRELQAGTLQAVLTDWHAPAVALHIVTPPERLRPARVQALIDHLARQFEQAPWSAVALSRSKSDH